MSDTETLQSALASIIPGTIFVGDDGCLYWRMPAGYPRQSYPVQGSSMLECCQMCENELTDDEYDVFVDALADGAHGVRELHSATWERRAAALVKAKGIV